jgi:hypothetical protein
MSVTVPATGPFCLDDEAAYRAWRAEKLARAPTTVSGLQVEVRDPLCVSGAERRALLDRLAAGNIALFTLGPPPVDADVLRRFLAQLGLRRLDHNLEAEEDGVTEIAVRPTGGRTYIPYTNRPLSWHTDGYYNPPERRVGAWALYCVRDAAAGGANAALDHEIAYIRLRDRDPDWIAALMAPDAMTIPANAGAGGTLRGAQPGPVFAVDPLDGRLHMRYSARQRNIVWRDDDATRAAAAALLGLFSAGDDHILQFRLAPGQGVLANNVLHRREGFEDDPARPRLLLRARYYDRVDAA